MTLGRKMAWQILATIAGLLLISGASLRGINGLHQDFDSAIRGYQSLREVYDASAHVITARTLLELSRQGERAAATELRTALGKFEKLTPAAEADPESLAAARLQLLSALRELESPARPPVSPEAHPALIPIARSLEHVGVLTDRIGASIERRQNDADHRRRTTMLLMAMLSAAVVTAAIIIGWSQYRGVTAPLQRLSDGVRALASNRLAGGRIHPIGSAEFVTLANDFNRMADDLDALYRDLERKVEQKSRELVQSERLASVGYLAAGVAHEINNPIGIIAGYAELTRQEMEKRVPIQNDSDTIKALRVIAEEAFRCKHIVARLLSLARPGEENRRRISLLQVASDVVTILGDLRETQQRQLSLTSANGDDLCVIASEGEMKQVILNLTLNALSAVEPQRGRVAIDVARRNGAVELTVSDNGRGMPPEVLQHVFEPFFTAKRGVAQPGTGLGLSISHAIISAHGGRISAHSEGLGKGSRFVVQLPAAADGGAS